MDPHLYCQETMAALLTERAGAGSDPERFQRPVVLSYLLGRRLSRDDFVRELRELSVDAAHGRPGVASAARAILLDWQERTRRN